MNKIIAIVGMCGSGKSVACDLLEKRGYKKEADLIRKYHKCD